MTEQVKGALVKALRRSVTAIDDWLNLYASELCNEERVAEAKARVSEHGTLWYIADIQQQNRAALAMVDHQSAGASSEAVSEAGDPQSVKRDMEGVR